MGDDRIEILTRRFERERLARKQAELILEDWSRELYKKNVELQMSASAERDARNQAETLLEALEAFASRMDTNEIAHKFLALLNRLVPYDACAVFLKEDGLRFVGGEEQAAISDAGSDVFEPDGPVCLLRRPAGEQEVGLRIAVPMVGQEHFVGRVDIRSRESDAFDVDRVRFLQALANEAAIALETAIAQSKELSQLNAGLRGAQEQLHQLAYYDQLTGLPNRTFFGELIRRSLSAAARDNEKLAVFFIDLDNFKRINEGLGHEAGDRLLRTLADRLASDVRKSDDVGRLLGDEESGAVSRLGGDEFVLLLQDVADVSHLLSVARRILGKVSEPIELEGHEIILSASVGISTYPGDGTDAGTLVKAADTAMSQAKAAGGGRWILFSEEMNKKAVENLALETSLRRALQQNEFEMFYQPIVDLNTRTVAGVEALVRWNDPEVGSRLPGDFVEFAEDMGLIMPIGEFALNRACHQARQWLSDGFEQLTVSVNVSPRQFAQTDLAAVVLSALEAAGLPPDRLRIEITERVLLDDYAKAIETLNALRDHGVHIELDDFGTGYSSLTYLHEIPVDAVKIDKSFVGRVNDNPKDASIVTAILSLARSLGLAVIAEGVEDERQAEFLVERGCDYVQGYLFCHPLPEKEVVGYFGRGL